MKIKNFLTGVFLVCSCLTFAQTKNDTKTETKSTSAVTEFKFETKNIEALKKFDWNIVHDLFEENEKDQDITLAFAFENPDKTKNPGIRFDDFNFKITGKTADVNTLIKTTKSSVENFINLSEKYDN